MPFYPKRSYKRKSVIRRRYKKKRYGTKKLVKLIKNVTLKQSETQYVSTNAENTQLYHNAYTSGSIIFIAQNMCRTVVGDGQSQRHGDSVMPIGIGIRLWLSNKLDRPNVMYRLMIVASPPDQVLQQSPSNFWAGVSGNKMIDYVNTDKYTILYHKIINPGANDYSLESGATNKEKSLYRKIWISLKRKGEISYSTDSGEVPKYQKHCISMVIIPYDATGTQPTDNIASVSYNYRFYFKDP